MVNYEWFLVKVLLIVLIASCQHNDSNRAIEKPKEDFSSVGTESISETGLAAFLLKRTKTIEDYYLYLPKGDYFNCEFTEEPDLNFRKRNLVNKNVKNGYLLATDSSDFVLEMALFKDRKNQRDIVAAFSRGCNIGGQCPPVYDFWTIENNEWKNLNEEFISLDQTSAQVELETGKTIGYKLPEFGTDIQIVNCDDEKELGYRLRWADEKFQLIRK